MKKIIIILFILLNLKGYSQDTTFYITDKKDVIWKKVFTTNMSYNELLLQIKKTGNFSNIDTASNTILGEIKRMPIDYSSGKETIWKSNIPLYIKMSDISATFELNYKIGKYQVIIRNINCIGKADNPTNNMMFLKPNELDPLKNYALKTNKLEINKQFLKNSVPIFDFTFNNLFSINENKINNW